MRFSRVPPVINAGVTLKIPCNFEKFPASEWTASLMLRGPQSIDIPGTANGDGFIFTVDAATTSAWKPGEYWFAIRVYQGSNVAEVGKGETVITPDIATAPDGFDGRSYAERVLEAIDAVIEKRASVDQQSYRINDRELSRTPIADLLALRDQFRSEVNRERARALGRNIFNKKIKLVLQ